MFQHLRIDNRQVGRIRTLQRQTAAIALFEQVTGKADHITDARHGGDVAQNNMKIDIPSRAVALEVEFERRTAARVGFLLARFCLEGHRDYRMVLIIFSYSLEPMNN